jgi:hypothetical protein
MGCAFDDGQPEVTVKQLALLIARYIWLRELQEVYRRLNAANALSTAAS